MTIVLLLFFQFVWSSTYVAYKLALTEMPIGFILIGRYAVACLALALMGGFKFEKFTRREWALILGMGVLCFTGSPLFQLKALTLTTATDTSFMIAFEPLITATLAVWFLKERFEKSSWFVFCVATLGVLILSGWKGTAASLNGQRLLGDAFFMVSLLLEGFYSVTSKHLISQHRPVSLVSWMMGAGFITNLITNFPTLNNATLSQVSPVGWGLIFYLGIFPSAIAYCGWVTLLKKRPASQLALSLFLQPIFGTLLAVLIVNEPFTLHTFFGGGMILGVLLLWLYRHLKKTRPSTATQGYPHDASPLLP